MKTQIWVNYIFCSTTVYGWWKRHYFCKLFSNMEIT